MKPLPPAFLHAHGQNHMLCGSIGIPCPSVLLPVGTVQRKINEIRDIAPPCHLIDFVCRLIGTVKGPSFFQVRAYRKKGKKLRCRLLWGNARYIEIAEPMICEHGFKHLFLSAAHNVNIPLSVAIRIVIHIPVIHRTVPQHLRALDINALSRPALDLQAEDSGIILPEVIDIATGPHRGMLHRITSAQRLCHIRLSLILCQPARPDFHRLQFSRNNHRLRSTGAHLSSRSFHQNRTMPALIHTIARKKPAIRFQALVKKYPASQIVEHDGTFPTQEIRCLPLLPASLILHHDMSCQLRRGIKHIIHKIPHMSLTVQKTVTQHNCDYIFPVCKVRCNIILVIIEDMIRIRHIRSQQTLRNFCPIEKQIIKSKTTKNNLSLTHFSVNDKAFSKQGRSHVFNIGGVLPAFTDKFL